MTNENILGNNRMNLTSFLRLIPIIILFASVVASFAVAKVGIDENKEDIGKLKKGNEQMIRMEERQKYIQSDIKDIKKILEHRGR